MTDLTVEKKKQLMIEIGKQYAVLQKENERIYELEKQLAKLVKPVFSEFGSGPHALPVPSEDGTVKKMICTFRRAGDVFSVRAVDHDSIS